MAIQDRLSGNEAVAVAIKQINPDVMAAFPITPSTDIPQLISQYVANGEMSTIFVPVESEHSAMSACIGAQAAGGRAMTATASCGLALMWEMLYVAASCRLPIVLACVNRALSGPINIHNDHSDSMGARDSGWIQIYAEDVQEAYDNYFQCLKIGEHKDVRLPTMACQDGFITSHGVERLTMLEQEKVQAFIGEYDPMVHLLNPVEPVSMGPYDSHAYYMETKKAQAVAMENSRKVILEVAKEFEAMTGRRYGMIEEYRMEDADVAMVIIGSTAGTAKETCDDMRAMGIKAGVIKIRVFRPFPEQELAAALSKVKALAIMDKCDSFSAVGGPLFAEVRAALFGKRSDLPAVNYIYGLGGKDVNVADLKIVFNTLADMVKSGQPADQYRYLAIRE